MIIELMNDIKIYYVKDINLSPLKKSIKRHWERIDEIDYKDKYLIFWESAIIFIAITLL